MRIRVGFMLDRHQKKYLDSSHNRRELERTGAQDHNETLRRQSRRNNTVCKRECELARLKSRLGHTTRFFLSPSISNNSPGIKVNYQD